MEALVYTKPNDMQLLDQDDPVPADNEVLLKIDAVGICGSDMHAHHVHDPRRKPGLILGHEFVGTVTQSKSAAFDQVLDAGGSKITRNAAFEAVKPGGVIMHIGLQDWASELDMRKLTLAEITLMGAYTYTLVDLQAAVRQMEAGVFGDLAWVETRALADGAQAFEDIAAGKVASAKVVLIP